MSPSVGRIVHYQSYGTPGGEYLPSPRAAVIAAVVAPDAVTAPGAVPVDDTCDIVVFNPQGLFFNRTMHAPGDVPTPGCWNWPPRTP